MAKYLKLFDTEEEYNSYAESDSLILPNVSFIKGLSKNKARFNPEPPDPFNGYEYVDLGLPSGLKWAKYNIGAEKESDYGLYFAWGEVIGYKDASSGKNFVWEDYKFNIGEWQCDGSSLTKYNPSDNLTTLKPSDDAATVNMGGSWRMPSNEEYQELLNNTTNIWTTVNGVNGRLFTGNNGNTLFFPASGYCYGGNLVYVGSYSHYWSSSFDHLDFAYNFGFSSNKCSVDSGGSRRYYGHAVRGVFAEK